VATHLGIPLEKLAEHGIDLVAARCVLHCEIAVTLGNALYSARSADE
jgi:hypothetical protein